MGADDKAPPAGACAVQVALRIRPMSTKERAERHRECVRTIDSEKQVVIGKDKAFTYDHVYGIGAPQAAIATEAVFPMIDGLFRGLNATVLAYGQTGSGKTYTMGSGNSIGIPQEELGIIPRCIHKIFLDLDERKKTGAEFLVTASFLELYNEDFNDLLDPGFADKSTTIQMRDDPATGGVVVVGIKEEEVKSSSEILSLLEKGSLCRTTGSTNMNATSSRSHAVFTITIEQSLTDGEFCSAKMRFVDLAGSERAKKTGAVGQRFKEGIAINQGLLCLGNVISVLGDPVKKGAHVPYRDSKLTRLLQDSLGGNSHTLMIACVSPADFNFDESLSTLKYANRARNIKNEPVVNKDPHSLQLAALKEQITNLQLQLLNNRIHGDGVGAVGEGGAATSSIQNSDWDLIKKRNSDLESKNRELQAQVSALTMSERKAAEDLFSLQAKVEILKLKAAGANVGEGRVMADEIEGVLESHLTTIASLRAENQALEDAMHMLKGDYGDESTGSLASSTVDAAAAEGEDETLGVEEEAANAEVDAEEQREFAMEQKQMEASLDELNQGIEEKAALVQQLQRSQKAFVSMKKRYDARTVELEGVMKTLETDKANLMDELAEAESKAEQPQPKPGRSKGELQGKLKALNQQLADAKKKQLDQERLVRAREKAQTQLKKLSFEVDKLRGQKEALTQRMKDDADRFKTRREEWAKEKKELVKKKNAANRAAMELKSTTKRQEAMIKRKTQEVVDSKMALAAGQQEILDKELALSKQRRWVEKELTKQTEIKEVNSRLEEDLERRESKVKEMEKMMEERLLIQNQVAADSVQAEDQQEKLEDLNEAIESLDAQIDLDSERIRDAQDEMVVVQGPGVEEGGYTIEARLEAIGELEEARATIQALFEKVEGLELSSRERDTEGEEFKEEMAAKEQQLSATQQRLLLAEREWDKKFTIMQKENEERILVMLSEVTAAGSKPSSPSKIPKPGASSDSPSEAAGASSSELGQEGSISTARMMECQKEQIALLTERHDYYQQQTHDLKALIETGEDTAVANANQLEDVTEEVERLRATVAQMQENEVSPMAHDAAALGDDGEISQEVRDTATDVEANDKLGDWSQENLVVLGELWTQIGLPVDQQQQLRASIVVPVVRLVMAEFERNMAHKQSLQDEMTELVGCIVDHDASLAAPTKEALAGKTLYEVVVSLRAQSQTLLDQAAAPVRSLLEMLQPPVGKQPKSACKWVSHSTDTKVLKGVLQPSVESFGAIKERLPELEALASEVKSTIETLHQAIEVLWKVLPPSDEQRSRIETKVAAGGFAAILELERLTDEAKAGVRLKVREVRSALMELWLQAKTPGEEQEGFLQRMNELEPVEAIEAFISESARVQRLMESMQEILKTIVVRDSLTSRIQEFEIAARNPDRLKGSSIKLLKEEKERKLFKRKNERLCVELAHRIQEWEEEQNQTFMVRGVPYLQILQAETADLAARGGTSLVRDRSKEHLSPSGNGSTPTSRPKTAAGSDSAAEAPSKKERPTTARSQIPSASDARVKRRSSMEPGSDRSRKLEEWRANRESKK